jgi:aminoglycoside phosphotransferase family enzyme/predicted kinase
VTSESLPTHIAALLDPAAYPNPVDQVELVQTHISYVLLAGDMVYKLKKPLDLGFLNFTTLRRRHYYCRQEVTLNRRLCADTYLSVIPVTERAGVYRLGGAGTIVDYAVQMRRLPAGRMMDHLLDEGQVQPEMVDRLADRIAEFHAGSATSTAIDRFGSPRAIRRNWAENFEQTRPYIGRTLSALQAAQLEASISAYMVRNRTLLRERVRRGCIRDCHGDLRASAVCFVNDLCIYDCIEFNRRFRYGDIASEVAFLAMDLDRRGRSDLSDRFVDHYQQASGDETLRDVLDFYRCYRAYVRGKVNSFQLDEPEVPDDARFVARETARTAFALACDYATRLNLPLLIVMTGLSGTGKSVVAEQIATARGATVIASDVVRKELAGIPATEHRYAEYGQGLYSSKLTKRTYAAMRAHAKSLLAEGQSVILDGTFQQRAERERAFELARKSGALAVCVETVADAGIVRQRLAVRAHDATAHSDARWETYLAQARSYEPVEELDDWSHVQVDSGRPLDVVVADALAALSARLEPAPLDTQ